MLDHLYAKFDKAYYAGLCKAIAVGKDSENTGSMYVSGETAHLPLPKPNIFPRREISVNVRFREG